MKLEVTKPYTRVYENPIAFLSGERVRVVKRDEDNPAWIWCVATDAREGWVHESFLEIHGHEATGTRDYNAIELTVTAGTRLEGIESVGGWGFCRNAAGAVGWVPLENVSGLENVEKALIVQIEMAFADVTKGDGIGLRESAANDAGIDPEQDRTLDVEQRWQELSDSLIEEHPMALIFTDTKGFRFLLPAFMRYAVNHLENPDANEIARDHAFQNLCKSDSSPESLVAFHRFRPEETKVIARFVRFLAGDKPSPHELKQIHLWEVLAERL